MLCSRLYVRIRWERRRCRDRRQRRFKMGEESKLRFSSVHQPVENARPGDHRITRIPGLRKEILVPP